MALNRFACKHYASLEINNAAFQKNGHVLSQSPLGEEYTEASPCENGMWVAAVTAPGALHPVAAVTDPIAIVYTAEKEYDFTHYGLNKFYAVAGSYPRAGIMTVGDKFTTNCFCYDSEEFADVPALEAAFAAAATTPVYVVPVANEKTPKVTKTLPASGLVARVVKYYTVPNGEKGIKYEIIRV